MASPPTRLIQGDTTNRHLPHSRPDTGTRGTYLNAQYLRLKSRRGHSKAIVAVANSILVSAYHVLNEQRSYEELGGDYFTRRVDTEHLTRRLVRQLERLGRSVTLEPVASETR